jgi:hypothetical protein
MTDRGKVVTQDHLVTARGRTGEVHCIAINRNLIGGEQWGSPVEQKAGSTNLIGGKKRSVMLVNSSQ